MIDVSKSLGLISSLAAAAFGCGCAAERNSPLIEAVHAYAGPVAIEAVFSKITSTDQEQHSSTRINALHSYYSNDADVLKQSLAIKLFNSHRIEIFSREEKIQLLEILKPLSDIRAYNAVYNLVTVDCEINGKTVPYLLKNESGERTVLSYLHTAIANPYSEFDARLQTEMKNDVIRFVNNPFVQRQNNSKSCYGTSLLCSQFLLNDEVILKRLPSLLHDGSFTGTSETSTLFKLNHAEINREPTRLDARSPGNQLLQNALYACAYMLFDTRGGLLVEGGDGVTKQEMVSTLYYLVGTIQPQVRITLRDLEGIGAVNLKPGDLLSMPWDEYRHSVVYLGRFTRNGATFLLIWNPQGTSEEPFNGRHPTNRNGQRRFAVDSMMAFEAIKLNDLISQDITLVTAPSRPEGIVRTDTLNYITKTLQEIGDADSQAIANR